MTFLKKLLPWKRKQPVQRVRICVECGMPVGEHRAWCTIFKAIQENPALGRATK
jgi:hypothetical protein